MWVVLGFDAGNTAAAVLDSGSTLGDPAEDDVWHTLTSSLGAADRGPADHVRLGRCRILDNRGAARQCQARRVGGCPLYQPAGRPSSLKSRPASPRRRSSFSATATALRMATRLTSPPSAAATLLAITERRGGLRRDRFGGGHSSQAITKRSAFSTRWRAAHRWATVRSLNFAVFMLNICPERIGREATIVALAALCGDSQNQSGGLQHPETLERRTGHPRAF